MKQITIAKSAGFCFGVDRAVRMTYEALEQYPHVATLGPIIHNQTVVDDLCQKGARIVEDVSELEPEECIVIRSHGVSKQVEDAIAAAGNPCINATCPFVSKIHKIVEKHTLAGDYILIAGDKNHPEVQAIVGHCGENCTGVWRCFPATTRTLWFMIPSAMQRKCGSQMQILCPAVLI